MKGFALCLAYISIACIPAAAFASDPANCKLQQLATIDLAIGTRVLMPVVLDGTPAFMGLGTSSALSIISKQAVDDMKWHLSKPPAGYSDAVAGVLAVQSFSLGSYQVGPAKFLVFKRNTWTQDPSMPQYIGWFGLTSLNGADVELDLAHNKLNLFSSNHCQGRVVYWADTAASIPYSFDKVDSLIFPMELDGKSIQTGIGVSLLKTRLYTNVSKKLYGFDENSPGIRIEKNEGSEKGVAHYLAMKMTARGLSVINADVDLVPSSSTNCTISYTGPQHAAGYENCYGMPPLLLGIDVLRHLRLYFATKEHILYFTAADAGTASTTATEKP